MDNEKGAYEFTIPHKMFKTMADGIRLAEYVPILNLFVVRVDECAKFASNLHNKYPELECSTILAIILEIIDWLEGAHSLTSITTFREELVMREHLSNEQIAAAKRERSAGALKERKLSIVNHEMINTKLLDLWRPFNEAFSVQFAEDSLLKNENRIKRLGTRAEKIWEVASEIIDVITKTTLREIPDAREFYDGLKYISNKFGELDSYEVILVTSSIPFPIDPIELKKGFFHSIPLNFNPVERFRIFMDICKDLETHETSKQDLLKKIRRRVGSSFEIVVDFPSKPVSDNLVKFMKPNRPNEEKILGSLFMEPYLIFEQKGAAHSLWNFVIRVNKGHIQLLGEGEVLDLAEQNAYFCFYCIIKDHFFRCLANKVDFHCPFNKKLSGFCDVMTDPRYVKRRSTKKKINGLLRRYSVDQIVQDFCEHHCPLRRMKQIIHESLSKLVPVEISQELEFIENDPELEWLKPFVWN